MKTDETRRKNNNNDAAAGIDEMWLRGGDSGGNLQVDATGNLAGASPSGRLMWSESVEYLNTSASNPRRKEMIQVVERGKVTKAGVRRTPIRK